MSQGVPLGTGSPAAGKEKKSKKKLDEETERLLTQLLLQRGAALQGRADEEGVLAFCRQPVMRERLNERFLQNTLRNVFANNKRVTEAAMWEQRQLQKDREEREVAAGPSKSSRRHRQSRSHRGAVGRGHDTDQDVHDDGSVGKQHAGREASPVHDSRGGVRHEARHAAGGSGTRSPAVEQLQEREHAQGGHVRRHTSKSQHRHSHECDDRGEQHTDDDRWQPSSSDEEFGTQPQQAHEADYESPQHGGRAASEAGTPARRSRDPHQNDASSSASSSSGESSSSGRSRSLSIPGTAGKGREAPSGSDGDDSAGQDGQGEGASVGEGGRKGEAEGEQPWVMGDDELQELLGRHLAKGKGGVGSRVEETGPYLPSGISSASALEGVPRGAALPPWLAAARSGSPSPGPGMLLQDPAAAARHLLARDRDLAKLLRKVAKRKLEEEEEEAGRPQGDKKKRRRSDSKHKSKKKSKKSKKKGSRKERKSRSKDR